MIERIKRAEIDFGKTSKFNAGVLQMQRIHDLQERLNLAKINPIAYNEDLGLFNYEIIINTTNALYLEAESKLGLYEKEQAIALKKAIEVFMERKPVHVEKRMSQYPYRMNLQLDKSNWDILRKVIFFYESLVRDYLEVHALNSPQADDPRFAAYT